MAPANKLATASASASASDDNDGGDEEQEDEEEEGAAAKLKEIASTPSGSFEAASCPPNLECVVHLPRTRSGCPTLATDGSSSDPPTTVISAADAAAAEGREEGAPFFPFAEGEEPDAASDSADATAAGSGGDEGRSRTLKTV